MRIDKIREQAGKRVMRVTVLDVSTGKSAIEDIPLNSGVDFLFNFLQPANREIGQKAKGKSVQVWGGLAVIFEMYSDHMKKRIAWKITVGKPLDEKMRRAVKNKVMAAFVLWGGEGVTCDWHETERGGIVLYLDERMRGLV